MAGEKFVDAERLLETIRMIQPSPIYSSYNDGPVDKAVKEAINLALNSYHYSLMNGITNAIMAASKASPCMLCKAPTDPALPPNTYAG